MLELVDVASRSADAYRGIAPDDTMDALEGLARDVHGVRILHVNATPYGGGVSELLRSTVPLLNGLGLVAHWKIIRGDERFFEVTKKIHNGLQGAPASLSQSDRDAYLDVSRRNAELMEEDYDFVFLHDPQPAGIRGLRRAGGETRWIWRCHIDTAAPNPDTWTFLRDRLEGFDAAIFTMADFIPPDLPIAHVEIMPPAIDPLSPKNMPLDERTARAVLEWMGLRLDDPLVTQVSRFDPWKDPRGVIAAYRLAREEAPDLQLALVGSMALDDPEGWNIYRQIKAAAEADPGIHVLTNLTGVSNVEVNALQRSSRVVIQKSIREGFGLVVSEALWKGTPVVAGRAGGIPLQMADGAGGALVDDVEGCARALVALLRDRDRARELGRLGHERVREHFLTPRLVLDELTLVAALARQRPLLRPAAGPARRDPVCGMTLPAEPSGPHAAFEGTTYRFCSDACRGLFLRDPGHYVQPTSGVAGSGD